MSSRLNELESIIAPNLDAALKVGRCFLEIRQDKLYRPVYKSFGAYLIQRWNFSRQYGYTIMSAAATLDNLSTVVDKSLLPESVHGLYQLQKELNGYPPEIAIQFVQLGAHIADDIGVPVTKPLIRALQTGLGAIMQTGTIEYPSGTQIHVSEAFMAQITDEMFETTQRQQQHIRESMERKHGTSVKVLEIVTGNFSYSGSSINIVYEMDVATAKRLSVGGKYRIVFYDLTEEKELA